MPLLPHIPESILAAVAGVGCVTCSGGALVFDRGYRRNAVMVPVICMGLTLLLHFLAWSAGTDGTVVPLFTGLAFFTLWGSYMVVPLLILGGLQEREYSVREKLAHASLIFSAFICGPVLVPFVLLRTP